MAAPVNFDATTPPTPEELTAAASIVIKDEDGKDVKLGDLYKDHKTITIFIRHFVSLWECTGAGRGAYA